MDEPESWRWIWMVAATVFVVGEIALPGTFFLASFAVGAGAASVTAFAGGALVLQWLVFVVASAIALAILFPLGRRLDRQQPNLSVGATRFEGRSITVLTAIPPGRHETGLVRLDREEWRAETVDARGVAAGAVVRVIRVEGTHLVVDSTPMDTTENPEVPQAGHDAESLAPPEHPPTPD